MAARHIPYAIGIFMLFPLVFWLVMSGLVIPGTGMVIDSAVTFAMLAVSMPLVAWFYIANLAFLSNNIGGNCEFSEPRDSVARHLISALPWLSLAAGVVSIGVLRYLGEPWLMVVLPFLLSSLIAGAILRGEYRRCFDATHRESGASNVMPKDHRGAVSPTTVFGQKLLGLLFHLPVAGWMLHDAIHGRESARSFFAVNLILLAGLAVWVFGYPALVVIALAGVVFCFAMLVLLTWN